MNENQDHEFRKKPEKGRSISTSLPFLFTIGALIFFISFLISSFPLGRNPLNTDGIQRVYFADNIGPGHAKIISQFNERNKGEIEVIAIDLPFSKFNTNQRKELIARNLRSRSSRIDVFSVDLIWVPRFTKWAEPLAPYFSPQFLKNIVAKPLETCYVDGALYAIPLYTDIGALYYREDMILALPGGGEINERIKQSISWEELLWIGEKYFPDQALYIPQAVAYEGLICNFNEILGQSLQDEKTGELIDLLDPKVIERVRFMRDLIEKKIAPIASLRMAEDECIRYALNNNIPFVRGWPTVNNDTDARFDALLFKKLAIAPLPHFEGERSTPVFGGWNMMLSKHSPVKEAAIQFIRFAASYEGQKIFYEYDGLLPIQERFYRGEASNARQARLQLIEKMMVNGLHRPMLDQYTLISDILSTRLHQIIGGKLEVEAGLKQAKQEIDAILDREHNS
ncbi:MAG: extracellular solute-binding protein [Candidatus Marinimicrobia bacterium]|nr:extracellular solute-binding protein [Candidatus Neomarinimicrobiota bacterium]